MSRGNLSNLHLNLRIFCFLGIQSSQKLVQNFKMLSRNSKLHIANENKKLDTILSQADASKNSHQTASNAHNGIQPLV